MRPTFPDFAQPFLLRPQAYSCIFSAMNQEYTVSNRPVNRRKSLIFLAMLLMLLTIACVRTASAPEGIGGGESAAVEDDLVATKDAQVQMTLNALLGSATAEASLATATSTSTPAPATSTPMATTDSAQLTALAEVLTAEVATATDQFDGPGTATATSEPSVAAVQCYEHRYVYDETYPDGTRVDPGESIQKTWRLQNVGTCDWISGNYELALVSGAQMSGQSPVAITYTVESESYANFSVNLIAPSTPGTYRGHWILRTTGGELIGWGPDADQSFWIEITVRGATPTP